VQALSDFLPWVGQPFHLVTDHGEQITAELLQADALAAAAGSSGRLPFSLVFEGPREPLLPQQTLTVRHPGLGEQAMFVVPVARQGQTVQYQAIFN
jgi:hypothetical protein